MIFAGVILFVAGCGGGSDNNDGGGNPPPSGLPAVPVVSLTPQAVKSFRFTWNDVAGETQYRLQEDATGSSGYVQVATIAANATSFTLDNLSLLARVNARYILQACNNAGCSNSAPAYVGDVLGAIGYLKASNVGAYDEFGVPLVISGDGNTLAIGAFREDSGATGVNGSQLDESSEDSGAVYVFVRGSSGWIQQAYLKASNTGVSDYFGHAIALSDDGNILVAGAPRERSASAGVNGSQSNDSAPWSGAAYVFFRSGASWSQQAYLKASNAEWLDFFGSSVSLSGDGNRLVIGAPGEFGSATGVNGNQASNDAQASGAAYVFVRSGSMWNHEAYLKPSNTAQGDAFGVSVVISGDGNTLAVTAQNEASTATGINGDETDNSATDSGAVYVFSHSGGAWSQQAYVKASNPGVQDHFGSFSLVTGLPTLAMSEDGNTLAVGAALEDSNATGVNGDQTNDLASSSGAAYVFIRNAGIWTQEAYLKASNTNAGDFFGISVALSADGNKLTVGAMAEGSNARGLNGDQTYNASAGSGAVYVFDRSGGSWSQQTFVKASNTNAGDLFGASVAISDDGDTLAVGAVAESNNASGEYDGMSSGSGAVYLY